jgi:hypothetical protein
MTQAESALSFQRKQPLQRKRNESIRLQECLLLRDERMRTHRFLVIGQGKDNGSVNSNSTAPKLYPMRGKWDPWLRDGHLRLYIACSLKQDTMSSACLHGRRQKARPAQADRTRSHGPPLNPIVSIDAACALRIRSTKGWRCDYVTLPFSGGPCLTAGLPETVSMKTATSVHFRTTWTDVRPAPVPLA